MDKRHMGAHGSHLGKHGRHVGWEFFEKLLWAKCPMNINKSKISHYLQYVQHQFWVHFYCHNLVLLLFCSYNKILLDFCFTHIMFFFLFFYLGLELKMSLFSFWFKKSYRLGCFCVCDSDDPSYIAYLTLTYLL